ncbi:hypothetical protein EFP18_21465 [Burkholderia glumae]|uniref:hypothetical protein n=1 Tax=Burkholderia glumae TaxID=337 RepID=UPI000F9C8CC9|nr:hypothetical protein [Burkholderia glumae]MCQ0031250.1 hypothetical protein [Burkholderia glumae]MCQ0038835.1 hypothetical protein [Burkholderia glumae]RQZ74572.1 hypothetical protein DF052_08880 [Burkholderia glumae]UVS86703.1 hypothetical protein EFP18_21465 [Burkholderia glumae]
MHASLDEIINAYKKLTADDFESLHDYAARQIRGTSFAEPDDLIQEAMARALAGSRKWPLRAPFGLFIRLAMRSIAQAEWAQRDKRLVIPMPDNFDVERLADTESGSSVEMRLLALERLREAQDAVAIARAALGDDFEAQRALDGVVWGTPPRETREELGVNERDFDAARQRAGRRLREAGEIVARRAAQRAASTRKPCQTAPDASRASAPSQKLSR